MLYNLILFLHILGTIIMFVAIGITLTAMISMLHTNKIATLRAWANVAVKMDGFLPFSVVLILFPGLYLVFSSWGWGFTWINISLATLIVMTIMGPVINLPRLKIILEAANSETDDTPSVQVMEKVRDNVLWNSVIIMTMLVLAILFIMTVKLALLGSILTLSTAVMVGFIVAHKLLKKSSLHMEHNTKATHI